MGPWKPFRLPTRQERSDSFVSPRFPRTRRDAPKGVYVDTRIDVAEVTAVPIVAIMPAVVQESQAKRGASRIWGDVDSTAVADRVKRDFVKKITNPFFSRCFRERVLDMEQSRVRNAFVATPRTGQREKMSRLSGPEQWHRIAGRTTPRGLTGEGFPARPSRQFTALLSVRCGFSSPNVSSAVSSGSFTNEGMSFNASRSRRLSHVHDSCLASRRQGEQHG